MRHRPTRSSAAPRPGRRAVRETRERRTWRRGREGRRHERIAPCVHHRSTVQPAAGPTRVGAKGAGWATERQAWEPPGPGPWMQDRAHLPASVTPLLQELYPKGFSAGFAAALRAVRRAPRHDAPGVRQRVPLHATGAVRRSRARRSEGARGARRGDRPSHRVGRRSVRSEDLARHPAALGRRGEASLDREASRPGDDRPLRPSTTRSCELTSTSAWITWRRCGSSTTRTTVPRWWRSATSCCMLRVGLSETRCRSSRSSTAGRRFGRAQPGDRAGDRRVARRIRTRAALLDGDAPAAERLAELRERVPAVDAYVRAVGFRIAAGFDLTNPTVIERPDLVLGRLAAAFCIRRRSLHRAR